MTTFNYTSLEKLSGLRFLLNVESKGMKLLDWAINYRNDIEKIIQNDGVILIRGLKIYSSKQFGKFLAALFDSDLLEYRYRSTPRIELSGHVYTATEYPSDQTIFQHNENAYSNIMPNRIGFCCMLAVQKGGETPISDTRKISSTLTKTEIKKFEDKGILYVRNYSGLDLSWSEVFQTESKKKVEQYCLANKIEFEWKENNCLKTWQRNPAFITHPISGEKLWVNQAHLFHVSSLSEDVQSALINELGEKDLPRNAYYGDGSPIEVELLERIRRVYEDSKIKFSWRKNDILLLDNLRFTHGRMPFEGPRKVLVGMAGQFMSD